MASEESYNGREENQEVSHCLSSGEKCQRPKASACFLALSRKSAILEFLLLLLAAAATTAAAEAESANDAIGSPKGGGGNIR